MKHLFLGAVSAVALTACSTGTFAQSMDYGALQQLFGEPVTTSATGSPQRAGEVPVTTDIITADDIRRSGAHDIPGVLRHVVGVDFQQWTNNQADVSVRGYDQAFSQRLLVLVNGRQVYADYFSFTPWSALPVELGEIRQIEVVRGPNSALFGFNAVGGVINIITYDPLYDAVNTASVAGGTQDHVQGSAVTTLKLGERAGFRLSGGLRRNDDFSTPVPAAMAGAPQPENNRKAVSLDGVIKLTDKIQLRIEASHSEADQNSINPVYYTEFTRFNTTSVKGQLTADTPYGLIQATAYNNWNKQDGTGPFSSVGFRNRVTVAQVQDILKLGTDHTVRTALEYRYDSAPTTPVTGGLIFYQVIAASGMWEWRISPSLTVTNALRVDHLMLGRKGTNLPDVPFTNADWNHHEITEPSFNSGVVWKASDVDTVRLTASRGVLLPNLLNFGASLFILPGLIATGGPFIQPTVVTNYEAGWDRLVPALQGQLHMRAFYQRSANVISPLGGLTVTPTAVVATASNIGRSEAGGFVVSVDGKFLGDWRWGLNYRGEIVKDHFIPSAQNGAFGIEYERMTPDHLVKANIGWAHGPWEIDGFVQYQSRTIGLLPRLPSGAMETPVADYLTVDGRVAYKVTDWATLAVAGQNLLHKSQRQTSAAPVERRVLGSLTFNF